LAYGSALLAGLLVFAIVSLLLFDRFEAGQRDLGLRSTVEQLAAIERAGAAKFALDSARLAAVQARRESNGMAIAGPDGRAAASFGAPLPQPIAAAAAAGATPTLLTVKLGEKSYRLATLRLAGDRGAKITLAWRDDDTDEALDRNLILAFLLGTPVVLLTAVLGGWTAAGRGLTPLRTMAAKASAIAADRLDQRLVEPNSSDEMTTLARALNNMLERLQGAFDRERRLTSDVSHELRAPLAVIRAAADHALASGADAITLRSSMQTVALEADELEKAITEVLAAARSDTESNSIEGTADVAAVAFDVAEEFYPLCRARHVTMRVECQDEAFVRAAPRALVRAVRAVLHNAVVHAQTAVRVTSIIEDSAVRLRVSDDGAGFSQAALAHAKRTLLARRWRARARRWNGFRPAHRRDDRNRYGRIDRACERRKRRERNVHEPLAQDRNALSGP
jgi:signal transduction histidine kinase